MKVKIFTLILITFPFSGIIAQTNDAQARQKYQLAKEAYNQGRFIYAASNLVDAKIMLGETNIKIQPLLVKCFVKLEMWPNASIAVKDYYALNPDKNLVEYAEIVELEKEIDKHIPKEVVTQSGVSKPKTSTTTKSNP